MAKIVFRVEKGGKVFTEVSETTGIKCEELTRVFDDALGTKVESQQKPEYFVEMTGSEIESKIYEGN